MKAEYDLALSNLKRSEDLASRKFISSSAQDTAASNAQVAEAVELAQASCPRCVILAPFDGVVGIRGVSVGDYVKDGADLVNVEDVRILKVDFRLPERNLTQIVGQGIEVVATRFRASDSPGTIDAINPRVDANGRLGDTRQAGEHCRQVTSRNVRARARDRRRAHQRTAGAGRSDRAAGVPSFSSTRWSKVRRGAPVGSVRREARVEILEGSRWAIRSSLPGCACHVTDSRCASRSRAHRPVPRRRAKVTKRVNKSRATNKAAAARRTEVFA